MSRSASCYATPMSSPPPPTNSNSQMMMNRTTPLTEFSADPGFAERAARFSCFGSRSFNGRTNTNLPINNGNNMVNNSGKLTRVSSTPALKALVSPEVTPGGEFSRKRKSVPKGKSKENPISTASPSPSFSKVHKIFPESYNFFVNFSKFGRPAFFLASLLEEPSSLKSQLLYKVINFLYF